ncbi:MAG TPA: glutamate racemase [Patescibacteria group bacterium]|nr:glutamate racemase [Patescibacteria group bacterium]
MIGVFDSGLGGLIVLKEILKKSPNESTVYFGDLAHLPYGNKSPETVIKHALEGVNFLKQQGAKIIIIACNTASAYAMSTLYKKFPKITFFDVISPAVQKALANTKNQQIGVIATRATIQSSAYEKAILQKSKSELKIKVYSQACPLLVPLIEEGWEKQPETNLILKKYLKPLSQKKIDTLILGCTHFPKLKNQIKKIIKHQANIIDSAQTVSSKLQQYLSKNKIKNNSRPKHTFFVSDLSLGIEKMAKHFLSRNRIKFQKIVFTN